MYIYPVAEKVARKCGACPLTCTQETTGDLHYRFFIFVQRLHQFATLQEIAQKGDKIGTEATRSRRI